MQHELPENQDDATIEKAYSTILKYRRYLNRWALPRWETTPALTVEPIEVERWLKAVKKKHRLENSTLVEVRKVMNLVYKHGQRYGLLPRSEEGNPIHFIRQSSKTDFEPVILTLPQVLDIFDTLRTAPELCRMLNRYALVQGLQIAQIAACNRLHEIEQRLARWLLMCQDRVDTDILPVTHEFLAQMLGTGRPSISLAAGILQRAGVITNLRGRVRILNRSGLERAACECYRALQIFGGAAESPCSEELFGTEPTTNDQPA